MADAVPGVDGHFPGFVDPEGSGGKDFADPVRGDVDPVGFQLGGESVFFPAGDVRDEEVFPKENFRFVQEYPSAGSAPAEAVGVHDDRTQLRGDFGVVGRGSRDGVEFAVDDLANHVLGDGVEIGVGGLGWGGLGHFSSEKNFFWLG